MAQPLHQSFVFRPPTRSSFNSLKDKSDLKENSPPSDMIIPGLKLCRNKALTSPPLWSRRRFAGPRSPVRKLNTTLSSPLRKDFMPPTDAMYWKNRCFRFQRVCQQSRKRIRDMEEDQRQLRRRIYELENRLSRIDDLKAATETVEMCSVSPAPSNNRPPTTILTSNEKSADCFYLADCEGMSDSEYGYIYDEDDDEE